MNQLYIWQRPAWPYFHWNSSDLLDLLVKVRFKQGQLLAHASLYEGSEKLTEIQKDIHLYWQKPLTKDRLCGWQASLFPTGFSGVQKIKVGEFRNTKLAFAAAPSEKLGEEVKNYLSWLNDSPVGLDGVLRAGMAYFWFLMIAPLEAGNHSVAVSLVDLALAQDEKMGLRLYDLNSAFQQHTSDLEKIIEISQKGDGNITNFLILFLQILLSAVEKTETHQKPALWAYQYPLNTRQKKIIQLLIKQPKIITNRDYVQHCETSRESAKRDLAQLEQLGILVRGLAKGRSVHYTLKT